MADFRAWLRQPTTVAGFSALLGTACALVLHQIAWQAAIPLMVGAVTSILMPDNAGVRHDAEALATEVVAQAKR